MTETGNPWVGPIDEWIENKKTSLEREMNDGQYSDQLALLVHLQKFMKTLPKAQFVEGEAHVLHVTPTGDVIGCDAFWEGSLKMDVGAPVYVGTKTEEGDD